MYAKYVSLATSVQAQVIADLAALYSGASIASLSASCDKVNSTLVSTVLPGWTLVDSAAPLSGCVITAPDADALTVKSVRVYAFSATSVGMMGTENWDAGTHVGTNPTTGVAAVAYSATVANTYVLYATPRSLWLTLPSGVGVGAIEFTRDCSYLVGTTYPCFAIVPSTSLAAATAVVSYVPRMKSLIAAGDVSVTVPVLPATISTKATGLTAPFRSGGALRDATDNAYYEIRPVWATSTAAGYTAILGKFYDVFELSSAAGANLDTFSDGTSTYSILNMGACTFAFKAA